MARILLAALLTTSLAIGCRATGVQAGGLIQKLPEDGSWAKYYITAVESEEMDEENATFTVSSVGRTTVDGEPCRWLELHWTAASEEDFAGHESVHKVLVPEAHLGRERQPSQYALRGWEKVGDYLEEVSREELQSGLGLGPMKYLLFSPDAHIRPQRLKQMKTIKYQKGELKCRKGITGKGKMPASPGSDRTVGVTYKIWTHEKVPFGVAAMKVEARLNNEQGITMEFTLTDFGTGAETRLPDHN